MAFATTALQHAAFRVGQLHEHARAAGVDESRVGNQLALRGRSCGDVLMKQMLLLLLSSDLRDVGAARHAGGKASNPGIEPAALRLPPVESAAPLQPVRVAWPPAHGVSRRQRLESRARCPSCGNPGYTTWKCGRCMLGRVRHSGPALNRTASARSTAEREQPWAVRHRRSDSIGARHRPAECRERTLARPISRRPGSLECRRGMAASSLPPRHCGAASVGDPPRSSARLDPCAQPVLSAPRQV
jgi:hypothetical protein